MGELDVAFSAFSNATDAVHLAAHSLQLPVTRCSEKVDPDSVK